MSATLRPAALPTGWGRRPLAAALAAAALGTAVAPGRADGQVGRIWLFGDVSFPARVDSFIALGTERWTLPERGTVLRYGTELAPGITVDVHVQPLPVGADEAVAVRQEFQRTLDELRRYTREGLAVSVDTARAVSVEAGGWTYRGHVAEATVRRAGTTGRTLAYVFAKPPSFVKVRITHDAVLRPTLDDRIRAFIAGILARVESFQDRRAPGGP